jgi:hypothetical protein
MFVGDQKKTVVLILQRQPGLKTANVMPDVQLPGRSISGQNSWFLCHDCTYSRLEKQLELPAFARQRFRGTAPR